MKTYFILSMLLVFTSCNDILLDELNNNISKEYVTSMATGSSFSHNCALTNQGNAICWGGNYDNAQLGEGGQNSYEASPVFVSKSTLSSSESFIDLSIGDDSSCGLTDQGNLYCWGKDNHGQLGDGGTNTNQAYPALVDMGNLNAGESFQDIELGLYHSCGLTNQNRTFCWGRDTNGQLGDGGANTSQGSPVLIDSSNLAGGEYFTSLSLGANFSCGLTNLNAIYCWGSDNSGQLGNGGANTEVGLATLVDSSNLAGGENFNSIELGSGHACSITNLNNVFCWGDDWTGQLGDDIPRVDQIIPVSIDTTNMIGGEYFINLSAGDIQTCGATSQGNSYCWGGNFNGELGDDSGASRQEIPVAVDTSNLAAGESFESFSTGTSWSCGVTSDNRGFCWGGDWDGQLGDGDPLTDIALAVNPLSF